MFHYNVGVVQLADWPTQTVFILQDQEVKFKSIRVSDPARILVDGKPLKMDKLAPSAVTVTAFSWHHFSLTLGSKGSMHFISFVTLHLIIKFQADCLNQIVC